MQNCWNLNPVWWDAWVFNIINMPPPPAQRDTLHVNIHTAKEQPMNYWELQRSKMSLCSSSRMDRSEKYPKEKVIGGWRNKTYGYFKPHTYRGTSIGVCVCVSVCVFESLCVQAYIWNYTEKSHTSKLCQSFPERWVGLSSGCSGLCCVLACGWTLDRLSGADGIWVQGTRKPFIPVLDSPLHSLSNRYH